jgi:hypothetical protein
MDRTGAFGLYVGLSSSAKVGEQVRSTAEVAGIDVVAVEAGSGGVMNSINALQEASTRHIRT